MKINFRPLASCGLAVLVALFLPLLASAHEHREVGDGQYEFTVGFLEEPAFVGLKNGLSLHVEKIDSEATPAAGGSDAEGQPVEGLVDSLKAEVIYGDQSMELELKPVFREPGSYQAIFFPTATGDYTFHITGEIDGVKIDESFISGPDTFDEVQPTEPLMFPKDQ